MSKRHLLFEVGDLQLAIPADLVRSVHDNLPIQPVAGTRGWFLGMGVAQGKLLPITDIGGLCGLPACNGQILELSGAAGLAGLQVSRVLGLSSLAPVDAPLDDNESAGGGDGKLALTTRAVMHQDRLHRVIDVMSLMQSPDFLNIVETEN